MEARRLPAFFVPVLALAVFAASCSLFPYGIGPANRDTRIVTDTAKRAQEQLVLGKHKRALEIYAHAYDRHHQPELRQGFARLGEQLRAASDRAYQENNFAEAGSIARSLFESGITTRDFADKLSFDDDHLTARITASSRALMEIGLMRYREEKLDEAIAIWKKALAFDMDNKSVKQAIDTATIQLQQLKHIK
jgi:tetratricopeptide (TPR) repeat protein